MSSVIRSLMVKVGADLTEFDKSLKTMSKNLKAAGKEITSAGTELTKGLTVPIAAAATGIVALATKAGQSADELITLSNKTGISTKALQELQYAARFVDVEVETMTGSMQKLTKNMDQARKGSKDQEAAFKTLGIEYQNADGSLRNAKEVWAEAIDALGQVSSEADKDALAMSLFGKSAAELNPLIVAGSDELKRLGEEAHAVGAVMSDENVAALGKFDDQMQKIQAILATVGGELASAFLPLLQSLMPVIQEQIVPAIQQFVEFVGGLVTKFTEADPHTQKLIVSLIGFAAAIGPALTLVGGFTTHLSGAIGMVGNAVKVISGGAGLISALGALAGPAGIVAIVIAALAALVIGIKYLWDNNEQFREAITTAWEKIKEIALSVWGWLKPYFIAIWDSMVAAGKAALELFGAVFETVFNKISAFWDQWGPAIKAAFELLFGILKTVVGTNLEAIKLVFETVFNVLSDIFDIFAAAFRGDWDGMWKGIKNLFSDIWNGIVGIAENALNGIIGIVNKAIEWLNKIPAVNIQTVGEVDFSGAQIQKHAAGGIFTEPTLWGNHLIGEAGPEALVPLDRLAGSGGVVNITVELDGQNMIKVLGQPLVDYIRVKQGLKY